MSNEQKTAEFYDHLWPTNVPNFPSTNQYISSLLPKNQRFSKGLDAGCGPGVTSLALAERCKELWAVDISRQSLDFAIKLAKRHKKTNIHFQIASLLNLPFASKSFELVFSWGVVHHVKNPKVAIAELCRVLKKSGVLVLAVYQKTWLTPFHEAARIICINLPNWAQTIVLPLLTLSVKIFIALFEGQTPKRNDVTIQAQVADWFFVPQRYFFSKDELRKILKSHHITFKITEEYNGRFKSTSNMVLIGQKFID